MMRKDLHMGTWPAVIGALAILLGGDAVGAKEKAKKGAGAKEKPSKEAAATDKAPPKAIDKVK